MGQFGTSARERLTTTRTDPGGIEFVYDAFGKPGLRPESGRPLEFNLSHSAGRALIAVTTHCRVGVDLESLQARSDGAEIARRFFSAAEFQQLSALPDPRFAEAFLGCWTKKEACLKACGCGLTIPMNRVSVPLTANPAHDPVDACPAPEDPVLGGRWSFYTLRPAPGYIGALALEGRGRRLNQWKWEMRQGLDE